MHLVCSEVNHFLLAEMKSLYEEGTGELYMLAQLKALRHTATILFGHALLAPTFWKLQASKFHVPAGLCSLQQNISSALCLFNGLENVA